MMNMQELSTCMQYALPIKIINLNNQALGMVKQWQDMQYGGRHSHSTYRDALPDFKALTESFGHVAYRVDQIDELDAVMADVFGTKHADDLVFVDAHIDPEEHVYPMAIKGGAMNDMVLERVDLVATTSATTSSSENRRCVACSPFCLRTKPVRCRGSSACSRSATTTSRRSTSRPPRTRRCPG